MVDSVSSETVCKRHKWSVVRRFATKKKIGLSGYKLGWWEVLSCRVCECRSGRWAR